jgi:hypothetical protein
MSQVSTTIPATTLQVPSRRVIAALIGACVVLGAALAVAQPTRPVPAPSLRAGNTVDGWEAGMAAQRVINLERVQDGYLPGLLSAATLNLSTDAMDGWEPGLNLGQQPRQIIWDGWEAGLP